MQNCINQFTSLAQSGKCRFFGNVRVGEDVSVSTLRSLYHAVVMVSSKQISLICSLINFYIHRRTVLKEIGT